jgi:hypothetical protein
VRSDGREVHGKAALLDDDREQDGVERDERDGGGPGGAHVSERGVEHEGVHHRSMHDNAADGGQEDFVVEALSLEELAQHLVDAVRREGYRENTHVPGKRAF